VAGILPARTLKPKKWAWALFFTLHFGGRPKRRKPSKMMKCFLPILFGLTQVMPAHQDPVGDVHPSVRAIDGNFVISFSNNIVKREYRTVFSAEGKLILPRHAVESQPSLYFPTEDYPSYFTVNNQDGTKRFVAAPNNDFHGFWTLVDQLITPGVTGICAAKIPLTPDSEFRIPNSEFRIPKAHHCISNSSPTIDF
jgi:hypothetical protein